MFKKVSVEGVPLTLELATEFAGMTPLPGERAMRPARKAYLIAQVLRKKFVGVEWAMGVCTETGITYRLDGQHSSKILSALPSGAVFPDGLTATITHYEFDTMSDAAEVFDLFNNPRSVRNAEDVMGVYRARVPGLEEYSRRFLMDVANGVREYESTRKAKGAKDALLFAQRERGMYFAMRPEFVSMAHWLASFRELKNATFISKPFIVSEMIAHRFLNVDGAEAFWPLVFTEGHGDPDHETRVLAEAYREMLARASAPKLDPKAFRRETRKAWKQFQSAAVAA